MNDLQILLIMIGALIIAAVLIFNWWQERRFHKQIERNFSALQKDVLFDESQSNTDDLDVEAEYSNRDNLVEDDGFSISLPEPEMPTDKYISNDRYVNIPTQDDIAEAIPEEFSIEDTYSELADKMQEHSKVELKHEDASLVSESKSAHHEEIKAIFGAAFNQKKSDTLAPNKEMGEIAPSEINVNTIEEPLSSLPAMLHAQMDLTALLYLAEESNFHELSQVLSGVFDGYEKPVYVHVLDANKQWLLFKDIPSQTQDLTISRVACSLQLADRAGPITRSVLNRFQLTVETLGLDINAHVEWQSKGDALTAANALDAFCIEVDKTMGFHLVHGENGAFTGTKLRGLAEAQGLVLSSDGSFKYFDEATNKQMGPQSPSFVMFNNDNNPFNADMLRTSVIKGITFQLDIPHVKHCAEAFSHMVQIARQMEIGLNAVLVDDNNKILGDIQIEKIRQQLKVIHATMLVRGIVPGSDSALRLFS